MTSVGTVISYPIPLFQNLPIEAQFYLPGRFVISNIALGQTTLVTTSVIHNYVIGQQVRLIIPSQFGCIQLNEIKGYVVSIVSNVEVELDIYSLGGNPFILATSNVCVAQILGIGDINSGKINIRGPFFSGPFIPGSFINTSPFKVNP